MGSLSSRGLNGPETSFLAKGLNFAITPRSVKQHPSHLLVQVFNPHGHTYSSLTCYRQGYSQTVNWLCTYHEDYSVTCAYWADVGGPVVPQDTWSEDQMTPTRTRSSPPHLTPATLILVNFGIYSTIYGFGLSERCRARDMGLAAIEYDQLYKHAAFCRYPTSSSKN